MEPSPSKFAPLFRDRLRRDVREPRSSWLPGGFLSGGRKDASTFVYERFAARARDGRRVGVADVWGAHLAATLLQSRLRFGGFGLAALRARVSGGDAPLPVFTAVEPLRHGPAWSEATSCERHVDAHTDARARARALRRELTRADRRTSPTVARR